MDPAASVRYPPFSQICQKNRLADHRGEDGSGGWQVLSYDEGNSWRKDAYSEDTPYTLDEWFGGMLLERKHPVLREYLERELRIRNEILDRLKNAPNAREACGRDRGGKAGSYCCFRGI